MDVLVPCNTDIVGDVGGDVIIRLFVTNPTVG